jgi:hypothetical protein
MLLKLAEQELSNEWSSVCFNNLKSFGQFLRPALGEKSQLVLKRESQNKLTVPSMHLLSLMAPQQPRNPMIRMTTPQTIKT